MRHSFQRPTVRAIVGALAANLAFAAIVAGSQAGPGYITVDDWSADAASSNTVRLSATTNGSIPKQPDGFINGNAIVGIAWADLGTGTALVATIHPAIGRDSNQRPDQWHLHTVRLTGGATAPNDFCLVTVATTPTAGLRIQGSTMTIDIAADELPVPFGDLDAAVGFTVHGDGACGSGFGVRLRI